MKSLHVVVRRGGSSFVIYWTVLRIWKKQKRIAKDTAQNDVHFTSHSICHFTEYQCFLKLYNPYINMFTVRSLTQFFSKTSPKWKTFVVVNIFTVYHKTCLRLTDSKMNRLTFFSKTEDKSREHRIEMIAFSVNPRYKYCSKRSPERRYNRGNWSIYV